MSARLSADRTPVLRLEDVHASYGAFRSLFGVSLQVGVGEAVALVGPNGVGKTTLARVASGLVVPTTGRVLVGGEDHTGRSPHRFARAGVAHAPEGRSVFSTLTIQENLTLSIRQQRGRRGVGAGLEAAYELFPRLAERRHQVAGSLSGGEQRMLSMARVLVDAPALLIADELSLGLAPRIVSEVYAALGRLAAQGTALLVIEQQVAHAIELCDRVVVLDHGRVDWTGPSSEASERIRTQLVAP